MKQIHILKVRRSVNSNYGFEKTLCSQGLSIKTPLNINYQKQALNSSEKAHEEYDKRRGWRGPITNKIKDSNWKNRRLKNINSIQLYLGILLKLLSLTILKSDSKL